MSQNKDRCVYVRTIYVCVVYVNLGYTHTHTLYVCVVKAGNVCVYTICRLMFFIALLCLSERRSYSHQEPFKKLIGWASKGQGAQQDVDLMIQDFTFCFNLSEHILVTEP